jgi:hypothetical protein
MRTVSSTQFGGSKKIQIYEEDEAGFNNAIEPTGISLWCFSFQRLWPGRLMASVVCPKLK